MSAEVNEWRAPKSSAPAAGARAVRWQPARAVLRTRLFVCLISLDTFVILGGFFFVGSAYRPGGAGHGLALGFAMLPIYLVSAFSGGAYAVAVIDRRSTGVGRALRAMLFSAGAILFVAFYLRSSSDFSPGTFAIGTAFNLVALSVARTVFLRNARRVIGGNPYSVVIISDGGGLPRAPTGELSTILATSSFDPAQRDPVMYDRLAVALRGADRVVVSCARDRRLAWVHALQGADVQAEILVPDMAAFSPLGVARFGSEPTLIVAKGPLEVEERALKRAFDIVVAATALIAFAPLLVVISIVIRLESPGSSFFVQRRIGRGNRMFHMLKFRSMRVERCDGDGHTSTGRDDDRITPFGRFLRRTSMDELPQLLNVLAGNMSIVGPRPHALGSRAGDELFWEIDDRYWHRHAAKPGLTGLAQVRGYRGATHHRSDLLNRLQCDLEYLHDWTIWRDILIVLQTFRVLTHRNAF
jgi:exopolysaccharide biosynthesis polyprenyl glycosylphosphotransferase